MLASHGSLPVGRDSQRCKVRHSVRARQPRAVDAVRFGVGQRETRRQASFGGALSRVLAFSLLLSSTQSLLTHSNTKHPAMQAAADAVKSAVQNSGSSAGSSTAQEKFSSGWKPDANAEKEAQGGDDSRPPGKQHTMNGAVPSASPRRVCSR